MPVPWFRSHTSLLCLLLLLIAALYWPGLSGPFIFDDLPAVSANHYLSIDGTEFDNWRTASLSSNSGPLRRPIAMWSFAANIVAAGGVQAFPLKLTNLVIHLACGVLVFALARVVLRAGAAGADSSRTDWYALLAAALWLLAPLHVSTVLYTVQRMAQLATLFALAGLVLYVHCRERWAVRGAGAGELIAAALWLALCTGLSAYSKENGILLLWLLPVMEVTLYRGRWAGRDNALLSAAAWVLLCAPLVAVAAVLAWSPDSLLGSYRSRDFSVEERLLTQLRLLWRYLAWMVYPDINSMGFQHDDLPLSTGWLQPASTLLAGIAWVAALVAGFLLRRRVPLLLFALLFYLVGQSMESSIWPLEMVYEHRNYLPSVGIYIAAAALLSVVFQRLPLVRARVPVLAVLVISSTVLFLRVFTWSDPIRLSAVNVVNHPQSSRSHFFLAESWLRAYRDALETNAPREETANYLILARNQFELMYQHNPRDMAAIVMLYYLDQHHFPELQAYNDWFAVLEEVAQDRTLQASDFSALDALLDCFAAGVCTDSRERLFALLDALEERYPGNIRLRLLRYRYLKGTQAPLDERLALLNALRAQHPEDDRAYQYLLIEYGDNRDVTGLFETVRAWMAIDRERRQLGLIRHMFDSPGDGAGQAEGSGEANS